MSLHCIHTQRRVKNGKTRRKREVLWSTEVVPEVRQAGGGSRLRFVFDVPGDLRGSGTERVGMYTFVGRLRDDGTILLGDGIRGSYLAGEVGRVLERETGLVVSSGPRT